jgi:hypothetical protein
MPAGFLENPRSWGCSTIYRIAKGCTPDASAEASPEALEGLREAAKALDGRVDLITADCAYTWFTRQALDEVKTPTLTSSLALLDVARAMGKRVAVVAVSGPTLLSLMGNELSSHERIIGLETKPEWARYQTYTVDTTPPLDRTVMSAQLLERLQDDFDEHGEPDVIILECTGLPQFRGVVRSVYRGPIIDIAGLVEYLLDVPRAQERQVPADSGLRSVSSSVT